MVRADGQVEHFTDYWAAWEAENPEHKPNEASWKSCVQIMQGAGYSRTEKSVMSR